MHPLRTVFQAISLSDDLTVEWGADHETITCNWDGLPEQNTLTKTLRLARELAEIPPLKIHIEKRIPAESGLGGGSSNAAALLRILQRKCTKEVLADHFLHETASAVGADVPFFLVGGTALAEGYGEILTPEPNRDKLNLVIARPTQGTSTAEAYRALDSAERDWREFPDSFEIYNDFERTASCASIEWMERLQVHGATDAGLSGSGSAVFGIFDSPEAAESAASKLKAEGCPFVETAHSLTREESLWTS
jgi:4-diphosphocytidyl-2-C-methyl-D-erythritol kinase